jgi:predicted DNA-binding transcriptional regulator AlpA
MTLIREKQFRTETLGLSPTVFWRLKKAGELPAPIVIGSRNFYTHDSIQEWLEARKKTATQDRE